MVGPASIHYLRDESIRALARWMLDHHEGWGSPPMFFGFAADADGELAIAAGPLHDDEAEESGIHPVHFRAAQLKKARLPLWGFGLLFEGFCEEFSPEEIASGEVRRTMLAGHFHERPTADEMCNAVIYDARGNEWAALIYRYLPDRGVSELFTPADTITKPPLGMAGFLWSAALLLDPANRARVFAIVAADEDEN